MNSINPKQLAGEKATDFVKNGMTVGLGTGSTAFWAIQKIGQMVKEGLHIKAIATSLESEKLARQWNIPLTGFADTDHIDLTIDGADEVDTHLNLIKGGGGALLREKIVAFATRYYIIVADESKYVPVLGAFGLPVEVIPFGWEQTARKIQETGAKPVRREKNGKIFVTDNHNYILDCTFGDIEDPHTLQTTLHEIPGIVECGLFLDRTNTLILGLKNGETAIIHRNK